MIHAREEALAIAEESRQRPKFRVVSPPSGKGRPLPRQCPDDFDVIFVEIGRFDCENWYRASRITINRWLEERGKRRLIRLRARFVQHQRDTGKKPRLITRSAPLSDRRRIPFTLARQAAHFLRVVRCGGWVVSPTGEGDWRVGTRRMTAAQMVDFAVAKGFDLRANLQCLHAEGVECRP